MHRARIAEATSMEGFPDPLVVEILQRLPLKSIFRFKSVSKHWLSIISDPFFIKSYTHQIKKSPPWTIFSTVDKKGLQERALIRHPDMASAGFSLQFLAPTINSLQGSVKLLASSNGLLLLSAKCKSQSLYYYVCNPLTKEWVSFPKPLSKSKRVKVGFLVDKDSGNYMVVRVAAFQSLSRDLNFEIFSSESSEWRCLKVDFTSWIFFVKNIPAVSYKGIIHWMVYNYSILAFDPRSNGSECRLIDLPGRDRERGQVLNLIDLTGDMPHDRERGVLGVSCGLLRYIEVADSSLGVWLIKDYDAREWCLYYRIELSECWSTDAYLNDLFPLLGRTTSALAFDPFNSEVVFLAFYSFNSDLVFICCNLSTRNVEVLDCESYLKESLEVFPFVLQSWPTPVPQPSLEAN